MQRWYEQNATLKHSIDLLQVFPDEVIAAVAEGFNRKVEVEHKAKDLMRGFKALGQEKVLALYKSKRKQRSYDRVPVMTTLLNYLLLLGDEHRMALAVQIIELSVIVQDYLDECQAMKQPSDVEHIKAFRDQYLLSGEKATRELWGQVRQEMQSKAKEAMLVRNFNESSDGLKLNFKRVHP